MSTKVLLSSALILTAGVQLYVPAKMIWDREEILNDGKEYKFETAPIDPTDPFRGKYITLSYEEDEIEVSQAADWINGESIYVLLEEGDDGYAKISSIAKHEPSATQDFVKAKVRFTQPSGIVHVTYPFDRYYMDEFKAYEAEQTYASAQRDTAKHTAYALLSILKGQAVIKEVMIDDTPIKELVERNIQERKTMSE